MIFVKISRKINTKKVLNKDYMFSFFKKRKQKFLSKNEKLIDLKINLVRNFRGRFRNMSLKYELSTNQGQKVVRAKIHQSQDTPQREWLVFNWLKKYGLGQGVPVPLDYFKPLNIFFYQEAPGISFEELFWKKSSVQHLKFISLIAKYLKQIHQTPQPRFLPVKDIQKQKQERRHWFFLVKKCGSKFCPEFSRLLKALWVFKQKNQNIFLKSSQFKIVHGDFHWGNIIKNKDQIIIIDFGYAFAGDNLEDVGGFLAQNDSMFRYYAPDFLSRAEKIRKLFLKSYFDSQGGPTEEENRHLLYFEIQKILEMAAILSLVEPNQEYKERGLTRLLSEAETKLKLLK